LRADVAEGRVEDTTLSVADRHEHGLVLAARAFVPGWISERGGQNLEVLRWTSQLAVELVVGVHPARGQPAHDRMVWPAHVDREIVLGRRHGEPGEVIQAHASIPPTYFRARRFGPRAEAAIELQAPATNP